MSSKKKRTAEARLEDLDVREVSIVDKPANLRRFAIVKRHTEEDDMARRGAIAASDRQARGYVPIDKGDEGGSSFAELLGFITLDDTDVTEPERGEGGAGDESGETDLIEKVSLGDTVKAVGRWLSGLTSVANKLKGGDEEKDEEKAKADLSPQLASKLASIAEEMTGFKEKMSTGKAKADDEDDEDKGKGEGKAKADDEDDEDKGKGKGRSRKSGAGAAALKAATSAISGLTSVANKLKKTDGDSAPAAVVNEIGTIGANLQKAVDKLGASDDDKDKKKQKPTITIKAAIIDDADTDNPEIVIKAGAKMKRARLKQLEKAVQVLSALLSELKGEDSRETKKNQTIDFSGLDNIIERAMASVGEKFEGFKAEIDDAISGIKKRVDDIDGAHPTGNGADDPPDPKEIEKVDDAAKGKKQSVFKGLFTGINFAD